MDAEETLQGIRKSYAQSCFLGGTVAKNLLANAGDTRDVSLIPGFGGSPGEGNGNPLLYSCLENFHGQKNLVVS